MKQFKLMIASFVLVQILWVMLVIWGGGSIITSSVKVFKNDCGKTYSVEPLFSGNWFCPK